MHIGATLGQYGHAAASDESGPTRDQYPHRSMLGDRRSGGPVEPDLRLIVRDAPFVARIVDVRGDIEEVDRSGDGAASVGHAGRDAEDDGLLVVAQEQRLGAAMSRGIRPRVVQTDL